MIKNDYKNSKLKDFIYIEKSAIFEEICDSVIDYIKNQPWEVHSWYSQFANSTHSYKTKEPCVTINLSEDLKNVMYSCVNKSLKNFVSMGHKPQINFLSDIRFNRYQKGQLMRKHCDHIHHMFDGDVRGIPTLSVIINLNDDYEGGELIFWDDYKVDLGKGDIIIFPSLFLFPHRVEEVKANTRYSAVIWTC
jgi:predicted 2-oxoglutarate/Fe(II)-dependent dioxygenase YbiX